MKRSQYLLCTIIALLANCVSLEANHHIKRAELDLHIPQLKKLSSKLSDERDKKEVEEVILYATKVAKAGKHAKPEQLTKALGAVYRALDHFKAWAPHPEILDSFIDLKADLHLVLDSLEERFPETGATHISHLPFLIDRPGRYYITENLAYTEAESAITVIADNVKIDCNNHALTLQNDAAKGIWAHNVTNLTIENAIIHGVGLSGISFEDVTKASIQNLYAYNLKQGITLQNSQNVHILQALLGSGVRIEGSDSIFVETSSFEGEAENEAHALLVTQDAKNIYVTDCTFSNWISTISLEHVTGLFIDNIVARASPLSTKNLVQLGTSQTQANDVQIKNSSFIQANGSSGFDGLFFVNGHTARLDNVIVDICSTNQDSYLASAIHIGCAINGTVVCNPELSYSDLHATGCIIKGAFPYGLHIEKGSFITFDESKFTDGSIANIAMEGARSCVIKDSSIANGSYTSNGIILYPGALNNCVLGCEVSHHGLNGITVSERATNSVLMNNHIFANGHYGIHDNDNTTVTYGNRVCKNRTQNCMGVSPAQIAGDYPVTAGGNVCCIP